MCPAASTRWCPTPEQVMILEEMYRGGVRTPNAAQIQQITSHLSLYGKIEGKNVFYWFQNHKARDRQKLRKRLLGGKQLHHHHHHHHQPHHHHFDHHMMMLPFPSILDHHHPFPPPRDFGLGHHQQLLHHFEQLPCCVTTSSTPPLGFHQLPPFLSPPCFSAPQPRSEEIFPRMGNNTTIYAKLGVENEKPMRMMTTNEDNHWLMMRGDHHHDYDYDYHRDNDNDDDDDGHNDGVDDDGCLKTLELFPIKDKTSLKEDVEFCGQTNNAISFFEL